MYLCPPSYVLRDSWLQPPLPSDKVPKDQLTQPWEKSGEALTMDLEYMLQQPASHSPSPEKPPLEDRTWVKEVKKVLLVQSSLYLSLGSTTLEHYGSSGAVWASLVSYLFLVREGIHINSIGSLFLMTHVSRLPTQVAHIIWKIPFLITILFYTKQFNYNF